MMLPTEIERKNAIGAIKKIVGEIKNSNDKVAAANKWNELTKNYAYLQALNKYKEIPEYKEAKELIFSLKQSYPQFVEYFKDFIGEE